MSIKGQLRNGAKVNPAVAPPFTTTSQRNYVGVDMLRLDYITDGEAAAVFVPELFELADRPNASLQFISFGFSNSGVYKEVIQSVECTFEGMSFFFPIRIFVNSDTPMISGREWFGLPKLNGVVDFEPHRTASLLSATIERPAKILLATGIFRPDVFAGVTQKVVRQNWGMRIIPGATAAQPNAVHELLEYRTSLWGGTAWKGEGSVHFTGASTIDPVHQLPVLQMRECTFLRDVALALEPTGRTLRLQN